MEGRKEHEEKTIKLIECKLNKCPNYMRSFYVTLDGKSYTTKRMYINYVSDFLDFLQDYYKLDINDIDVFSNIRPSMINSYVTQLNDVGESIKASRVYGIKNFFSFLVNDGYINSNPCDRVNPPKDKQVHKITSLTKEEIEIVKNNIMNGVGSELSKKRQKQWRTRDYAIVMLALSLGLRVTSLTEINMNDIDFENNEIKIVEKGNKERYIMFSDSIKEILNDWIEDRNWFLIRGGENCDALFISSQLKRINQNTIADLITKYTYNIDKHITPHKLRSTCATNVYNATGDIYLTADILGHADLRNTKRYAAMSEERKKKAAQAMDDILF